MYRSTRCSYLYVISIFAAFYLPYIVSAHTKEESQEHAVNISGLSLACLSVP